MTQARDTDWALRRSYASPAATPRGATPGVSRGGTPARGTPAATPLRTSSLGGAAKRPRDAAPEAPPAKQPHGSITDDLLRL
jgi:hypothetical protein